MFADADWRKSSHSFANGNCVEVAAQDGMIGLRDSTDPSGPVLAVPGDEWTRFLGHLKRGSVQA